MAILRQLLLILLYSIIGLQLALPISYFFQSRIYHEMTWFEYISGGKGSLIIGAEFGAISVYRYTLIASVIGTILMGKWIESRFRRRRH